MYSTIYKKKSIWSLEYHLYSSECKNVGENVKLDANKERGTRLSVAPYISPFGDVFWGVFNFRTKGGDWSRDIATPSFLQTIDIW